MTMQTNIASAMMRLVTATNAVNSKIGNLASLTTTEKSNIVGALNELKTALNSAAIISDSTSSTTSTWSSSKIQTQITSAITALINGADGASDTLKELADKITALAQADVGLLSFAQAQTLTAGQQLQGATNLGIGDPNHNYVTAIDAALSAGL
jgi:capsid protein